eukprot:113583-Prymnesium_polylepis.1
MAAGDGRHRCLVPASSPRRRTTTTMETHSWSSGHLVRLNGGTASRAAWACACARAGDGRRAQRAGRALL